MSNNEGERKYLFLMCIVGFLIDFAIMVGVVSLPFLVLDHLSGGNTSISGKIFAVQMGTYTLACLLMAGIVRKSKNILIWPQIGLCLFIFSYPLFPFFNNAHAYYLFSMISFIGMALCWPAFYAWVGSSSDERNRQFSLAVFNIAWSMGFTVSPLIAGPMYDFDYRAPYLFLLVISLVSLVILFILPGRWTSEEVAKSEGEDLIVDADAKLNGTYLYPFWIGVFLSNLLVVMLRATYPEHFKNMVENGLLRFFAEDSPSHILLSNPATKFSWPSALLSLGTAGLFLAMAKGNFWKYRVSILFISQLLSALAVLLLAFTKSLVIICLCFGIIGANHGLTFFASTFYSVHNPELSHRRASINEGLVGLGGVVGSLALGSLVNSCGVLVSYKIVFGMIILLIVIELLVFIFIKNNRRSVTYNGWDRNK
ncbi:MAG: MFS transporter [Candidatus Hydrogenedentes bacterium]|nr:MFS transporter [Candidatus Hydrogenedentota bacterium]